MLEGMAIGIKPMTNKGNKILNACIKTKIMLYLHLIYLLRFYVIYTWVFFFFTNKNHIYILYLLVMFLGFVWVSLNNYFYIPSFQNSSRISLIGANIKLHQVSKISFATYFYFIVNLNQEIRTVMFLSKFKHLQCL